MQNNTAQKRATNPNWTQQWRTNQNNQGGYGGRGYNNFYNNKQQQYIEQHQHKQQKDQQYQQLNWQQKQPCTPSMEKYHTIITSTRQQQFVPPFQQQFQKITQQNMYQQHQRHNAPYTGAKWHNNMNYSYLHSYDVSNNHTSMTCTFPKRFANHMQQEINQWVEVRRIFKKYGWVTHAVWIIFRTAEWQGQRIDIIKITVHFYVKMLFVDPHPITNMPYLAQDTIVIT